MFVSKSRLSALSIYIVIISHFERELIQLYSHDLNQCDEATLIRFAKFEVGLRDISPRRHFSPGHFTPVHFTPCTFHPTYVLPHVRFTPRTFHPTYVSPHVRFTPRTFHPTYVSPHVRFTPRTFHPTYV